MIHKYRQILFYSVLVFLFILSCSMRRDPDMGQPARRHYVEQSSHSSEDTEETGSGNGGGLHYDRASDPQDDDYGLTDNDDDHQDDDDDQQDDNDDDIKDDDAGDAGLTPVIMDTRGPSHGFWPEDTQCSRHW